VLRVEPAELVERLGSALTDLLDVALEEALERITLPRRAISTDVASGFGAHGRPPSISSRPILPALAAGRRVESDDQEPVGLSPPVVASRAFDVNARPENEMESNGEEPA
jgi:hypothetical protein